MIDIADKLSSVLSNSKRSLGQAALRFVLDQDAVSSCVVGMRAVEQVEENVKSSQLDSLTEQELDAIYSVFYPEEACHSERSVESLI
jgi:aryl-alcohol dehydrogenase-like predicted oxidoreductase